MSDQESTQEVVLIPVDENGRVLLFSDVKIENVDRDYHTVRDAEGLTWKLQPGRYVVKVFLRDFQMKTISLTVSPGISKYRLPVTTVPAPVVFQDALPDPEPVQHQSSSQESKKLKESDPERKRFPISFPVSYRTDTGQWVKAKALNVSASGVCVENVGHVTEDDNLYVKLHVPVATIPIECPARVVWVMSGGTRKPCMGLQLFLTSNMRESLDRWLAGI